MRGDEAPAGPSQAIRQLIGLVAIPWVILRVSTALVFALGDVLRFDSTDTANLLLQIPLGNTSCIGYSLIPLPVGAGGLLAHCAR